MRQAFGFFVLVLLSLALFSLKAQAQEQRELLAKLERPAVDQMVTTRSVSLTTPKILDQNGLTRVAMAASAEVAGAAPEAVVLLRVALVRACGTVLDQRGRGLDERVVGRPGERRGLRSRSC